MGSKKGLLGGSKFNGRHTSLIDEAAFVAGAAKKMPKVKKISIGMIDPARVGRRRIKMTGSRAGLQIMVRGTHAAQKMFIFTAEPAVVGLELEKIWQEAFGCIKK